jgi:hypothetical protein
VILVALGTLLLVAADAIPGLTVPMADPIQHMSATGMR